MYIIESIVEKDDTNEVLYWNNQDGWTLKPYATRFTEEEKRKFNLPTLSKWVRLK